MTKDDLQFMKRIIIITRKGLLNMNRVYKNRKVKYPCLYSHFKGGVYATMGVSNPCSDEKIDSMKISNFIRVTNSQCKGFIVVYVGIDGKMYHSQDVVSEELVLYKYLGDDSGVFATPVEKFLSEIDREEYPQYLSKYIFEEHRVKVKTHG